MDDEDIRAILAAAAVARKSGSIALAKNIEAMVQRPPFGRFVREFRIFDAGGNLLVRGDKPSGTLVTRTGVVAWTEIDVMLRVDPDGFKVQGGRLTAGSLFHTRLAIEGEPETKWESET